jgi:ligand-binding SRPBCC domain-containing protein
MIIRNKIRISAPSEKIWDFIADPSAMKSWNPRIKEVVPVTLGRPKANSQYRIRYKLGGAESNYLAEIMEYEEFSKLVLHLEGGILPQKGFIQEIYNLTPDDSNTLLIQQLIIENSGRGMLSALLLRMRNMAGKTAGKKYLSKLKEIAVEKD